uniref:Uncharacterized protein n=1 Tax=Oryza meridionalis TaxID=40149 RepID=A0A0E0C282_9ORYZ
MWREPTWRLDCVRWGQLCPWLIRQSTSNSWPDLSHPFKNKPSNENFATTSLERNKNQAVTSGW